MEWIAICLHKDCRKGKVGKYLDSAPNGVFVEASAKRHKRDNPAHTVLVAYEVKFPLDEEV